MEFKTYDVTSFNNNEQKQLCIDFDEFNMHVLVPFCKEAGVYSLLRYSLSLKELADHIKPFMEGE